MKHTIDVIVEALKVIQDECDYYGSCGNSCPFEKYGQCVIQNTPPEEWEINSFEAVWKAFI